MKNQKKNSIKKLSLNKAIVVVLNKQQQNKIIGGIGGGVIGGNQITSRHQ